MGNSHSQKYGLNFSREQYNTTVRYLNGDENVDLSSVLGKTIHDKFFDSPHYFVNPHFYTKEDSTLGIEFLIYQKTGKNFSDYTWLKDFLVESFDAKTIPNTYEEFCEIIDESFKQLSHILEIEKKSEKVSDIDDLIARATAISEQSRGLADDLRNRFKYEELLND